MGFGVRVSSTSSTLVLFSCMCWSPSSHLQLQLSISGAVGRPKSRVQSRCVSLAHQWGGWHVKLNLSSFPADVFLIKKAQFVLLSSWKLSCQWGLKFLTWSAALMLAFDLFLRFNNELIRLKRKVTRPTSAEQYVVQGRRNVWFYFSLHSFMVLKHHWK